MTNFSYDLLAPYLLDSSNVRGTAKQAGVSPRQVRKAMRYGMDDYLFDRMCNGLGLMPHEVAGERWFATGVNARIVRR